MAKPPEMQGKIVLEGLEFHAHHGVYDAEAQFGARFVVDLELFLPLPSDDDLAATVDYSAVYELVRHEVTGKRFGLLEALARRLADAILAAQPLVAALRVRVHKPHAPLPGIVRDVYVEFYQARSAGGR